MKDPTIAQAHDQYAYHVLSHPDDATLLTADLDRLVKLSSVLSRQGTRTPDGQEKGIMA